jgi:hypothetical protein
LDTDHRRTVRSARGIMYRSLARKDSRIWVRGSRDCEKQYLDSWRIVWAIAEREWNTGGTKPSGSRREKSRSIGVKVRESRSAESVVDGWTRIAWR